MYTEPNTHTPRNSRAEDPAVQHPSTSRPQNERGYVTPPEALNQLSCPLQSEDPLQSKDRSFDSVRENEQPIPEKRPATNQRSNGREPTKLTDKAILRLVEILKSPNVTRFTESSIVGHRKDGFGVRSADAQFTTTADWKLLSAEEKLAFLLKRHEETRYDSFPRIGITGAGRGKLSRVARSLYVLSTLPLNEPFREFSDLGRRRIKVVSSDGTMASAEFIPKPGSPYTGILGSGGTCLLRVSILTHVPRKHWTLGIGIKFPISGGHSANLSILPPEGVDYSTNISDLRFSNRRKPYADSRGKLVMHVAGLIGLGRDVYTRPLRPLTYRTQQGSFIPPSRIKTPHELVIVPKGPLKEDTQQRGDFRERLSRLVPGSTIFSVQAKELGQTATQHTTEIGELVLSSPFFPSMMSEQEIMFFHPQSTTRAPTRTGDSRGSEKTARSDNLLT